MNKNRGFPVVFLLFLSPFFGEVLSGSSPPMEIIQPVTLILQLMLYGCGALLIRELAVRKKLTWAGVFLVGMAYGIYEEGIVVRSFFDPTWMDLGILAEYGRALGVNWVWTLALTLFHAVISITLPIMITYLVFPKQRSEPWLKRGGLIITSICFLLMVLLGLLFDMKASWLHLISSWFFIALLIFFSIRQSESAGNKPEKKELRPFMIAIAGFALMVGFFMTMWLFPELGMPSQLDSLFIILLLIGEFLLTNRLKNDESILAYISGHIPLWIFFTIISETDVTRTDDTTGMIAIGILTLVGIILLWWQTKKRLKRSQIE